MRYIASAILALFSIVLVSGPAAAQSTKVFRAASAWALDYGDDYCRLMRDFSGDGEAVGLFLERTQPGPFVRIIAIGDSVRLYRGAREIGYRMHPAGAPRTTPRLRSQTASGQQYLNLGVSTFADMPPFVPGGPVVMPAPYSRETEAGQAAGITGIALERGLTAPILIETGGMEDAVRALQACADDLLVSWGLDAEAHKALSRPAMPDRATAGWIPAGVIPFADFGKISGGNNDLRVMINSEGMPVSCHVQWPVLDVETNKKICDSVVKNGNFLPALDRDGKSIDSYWSTSIFLLLPPFGR